MPLDPQAQKVVEMVAALNLKPIRSPPPTRRGVHRTRTAGLGPVEDVPAVADHRVPVTGGEITVRVYSPAGHGPHPVLVFYHGGGWVIGDLDTHDGMCRALVNAAGCAGSSVDYRLAPELQVPGGGGGLLGRRSGWRRTPRASAIDPRASRWAATARAATSPR